MTGVFIRIFYNLTNMKNTLRLFTALAAMALAVAMTLTACDKDKPAPERGVTVTGGQQTQTVFADKNNGTSEVKFETTGAWTSSITEGVPTRAEADTRATAVWVSISPSSGTKAGDYTIDITLDDNYTGADRTATITITSGGDSITITVTQKAVTESGEKPVETVAVTGVTLNKPTLALVEGATETLTATIAPDNATDEAVTWKSSDEAVATVDANGKVTAVASGSATITVTSTADATKTATCEVTVTATTTTVPVTGVSLDKSTLALVEGDTETLTATVAPATATDKAITWKSDKPDIADVDGTGKVTAKRAGSATITATSAADATKTATCNVTVSAPAPAR